MLAGEGVGSLLGNGRFRFWGGKSAAMFHKPLRSQNPDASSGPKNYRVDPSQTCLHTPWEQDARTQHGDHRKAVLKLEQAFRQFPLKMCRSDPLEFWTQVFWGRLLLVSIVTAHGTPAEFLFPVEGLRSPSLFCQLFGPSCCTSSALEEQMFRF